MSSATVIRNDRGDFEVVADGERVKGGYFSRMEDYAHTEAAKFARIFNLNRDQSIRAHRKEEAEHDNI